MIEHYPLHLVVKSLMFCFIHFAALPSKYGIFRYFSESIMKHSGAITMENEPDLQKAKSEEYGLFAAFITVGVLAALVVAFLWLY